jgi:ribonuclease R
VSERIDWAGREESAERALLGYLRRSDYRPLAQRQLLHRMHVSSDQRPLLRRLIRRLLDEGKIAKIRGGRLVAGGAGGAVTGKLHRHRGGFGFVAPDGGGEDLFIAPPDLGAGMTGDRVSARVTGRGPRGRLRGVILETVERRSRRIVGLFSLSGRAGKVQPFDPELVALVHVPASFRGGAEDGEAVEVEILRDAGDGRSAEGKVLERLGHLDDPGTDVLVVSRKYGLKSEFPSEVLAAARKLPSRIGPAEASRRKRFDDPPAVPIDGETAKDFDDAIAVRELRGGGFRLWVHIADVAHFVEPDSALDAEARRRGTSVYFPDRVLPMFPEKLSTDLCSLRPRVDRLVQTAILDVDDRGRVKKARFSDGVIRSAARLTYTQVAEVLAGADRVRGVPARVVPMLRAAGRLREALEGRRARRGSVDFDLPEPQILLDVEGAMTGVTIEPRNEAHRLIEECMLAANEAVARELERRERACMYRVHDAPDPAKIAVLGEFVNSLGVDWRPDPGHLQPGAIRRLMELADGRPDYALIAQTALRSMRQARYGMEHGAHFGLAAPTYCHFTSPIRRYPDLVNHRLLRDARRRKKRDPGREAALVGVAASASELERNAESAERELLLWKKIAFVRDRIGERLDGVVTGVVPFGLFVQLTESMVEGLLHVERLGGERFEFDASRMRIRGERSGATYRLGDRLEVIVDRVDPILQRVDFSPAEPPAPRPVAGRSRRRRRR